MLLQVLLLLCLIVTLTDSVKCSDTLGCSFASLGCILTPDEKTLDCSQLNIQGKIDLRNLPSSLHTIYMNLNQITSIAANLFHQLPNLRKLYLSNNQIETLSLTQFRHNHNLEILNIGNNLLRTLHEDLFKHNIQLTNLDLNHNLLGKDVNDTNTVKPALHSSQFDRNINLEVLNLFHNYIDQIDPMQFTFNPLLRWLNMGNNRLTTLHLQQFQNNLLLVELDVMHNPLDFVLSGCTMPSRDILNCSGGAFVGVHFPSFSDIPSSINVCDLSANNIATLSSDAFVQFTNLTTLNLANNNLLTLPLRIFEANHLLTTIELDGNLNLDFVAAGCVFRNYTFMDCQNKGIEGTLKLDDLPRVNSIDVSKNHITIIGTGVFERQGGALKYVNLSNNRIVRMEATTFDLNNNLLSVDLHSNPIATDSFTCGPRFDFRSRISIQSGGDFFTCSQYQ